MSVSRIITRVMSKGVESVQSANWRFAPEGRGAEEFTISLESHSPGKVWFSRRGESGASTFWAITIEQAVEMRSALDDLISVNQEMAAKQTVVPLIHRELDVTQLPPRRIY